MALLKVPNNTQGVKNKRSENQMTTKPRIGRLTWRASSRKEFRAKTKASKEQTANQNWSIKSIGRCAMLKTPKVMMGNENQIWWRPATNGRVKNFRISLASQSVIPKEPQRLRNQSQSLVIGSEMETVTDSSVAEAPSE
jgi:hypothetical protein